MTELNGPYGPHVKIVCRPAPGAACDLCVDVRDVKAPTGWRTIWSINDSEPNALLEATLKAKQTRAKLMEGENV